MCGGGVLALVRLGIDEGDVDLQRRVGQKAHELRFRLHLGGHQVQNGDLQRADVLREGALVVHDKYIFRLECGVRGDIAGNDDGHCSPPL